MKGLWLESSKIRFRDDLEKPIPRKDEALVKVRMAGICRTDLELLKGYYPFTGVIGHEFVGEIVDAPSSRDQIGERVVGEINAVCGQCRFCRNGLTNHCSNRTVLGIVSRNGAFAEFLTLPLANLIRVPEEIPDEKAVFAEPLAAALQILEQVHIRPQDRILLVGAGKLGLLIAMVIHRSAARLTVLARYDFQAEKLGALGIETVLARDRLTEPFDVVIDASGSPEGFDTALKWVRPCGKLVLKSTYRGSTPVDLAHLVVNEIELIGSRCGPFRPAIRLLGNDEVDPSILIDRRLPLKEGVEALQAASKSKGKILIDIRN